ncbi:MAG: LLM class flavin-dependent oxidoreductase [Myxococcota bacterium]
MEESFLYGIRSGVEVIETYAEQTCARRSIEDRVRDEKKLHETIDRLVGPRLAARRPSRVPRESTRSAAVPRLPRLASGHVGIDPCPLRCLPRALPRRRRESDAPAAARSRPRTPPRRARLRRAVGGEHHSASFETIASPEASSPPPRSTRRIRLGIGRRVSCPITAWLMVAERITQLDHQTGGRVSARRRAGVQQLPSDAHMMGIDVARQRGMMNESLEVLIPLLRGETVTHSTDWFTLRDARVQLAGRMPTPVEMAVAAAVSPSGPSAAGRHGIGMLSMAATSGAGFDLLPAHWALCEDEARRNAHTVDRRSWRLVVPMHLAEFGSRPTRTCGTGCSLLEVLFRAPRRRGDEGDPDRRAGDRALDPDTASACSVAP